MIDSMDQGIGTITSALKRNGMYENTLILFFQDNGGCAEGLGRRARGPYTTRPEKAPFPPMARDELQKDMIPKKTRDGWPIIQGPGVMPGPDGTYIAYGRGWANVSNTPFREYKHWVHEGGISTPLIAHWPAGIQRRNELEHTPGHLVDLMATCVDAAGARYPTRYHDGREITPMEGRSLLPAFAGKPVKREALFWEHEGNRAIRVGDMKLVAKGAKGPWELYDIGKDRAELHNLVAERPEQAQQLAAQWQTWAERARVLPLNPRKTPAKKSPPKK
jgi:arylsulfatase